MTEQLALLFKFGKHKDLESFRSGTLFMNTQRYFSEHERDALRGDEYEGTDQIHQPRDIVSLRILDNLNGTEILLGPEQLAGPLKIGFGTRSYNLFCMYAIMDFHNCRNPLVDPQNLRFGDSFIVVRKTQPFLKRVAAAIASAGLVGVCKPVEYFDLRTHSGDTGPFRKPSTFSFQQEFRIAAYPGSSDAIKLSLGNLEDITTRIFPLADINNIVKCSLPDD